MTLPRNQGVILAKVAVRAQIWNPLSGWPRLGDLDAFAVITQNFVLIAVSFTIQEISRDEINVDRPYRIVRERQWLED